MIILKDFAPAPKKSPEAYRNAWQRHAGDLLRPATLVWWQG